MRLLLVEDQPELARFTSQALRAEGYVVDVAASVADAFAYLDVCDYDLFLLDRQLPDGDGLEWLRKVRRNGRTSPALIMTAARQLVGDRIEGLEAGADDYVLKPVDNAELVARVKALLRRPKLLSASVIEMGNVCMDLDGHAVTVGDQPIRLSPREFALLEGLMRREGKVVSKASIEQLLYGLDEEITQNAIEAAIYRLRSRLVEAVADVRIHTVRGVGYILSPSTDPQND